MDRQIQPMSTHNTSKTSNSSKRLPALSPTSIEILQDVVIRYVTENRTEMKENGFDYIVDIRGMEIRYDIFCYM